MRFARSCTAAGAALTLALSGCGDKPRDFYPGYVEADYVRLASPIAGTLARLYLQRGSQVERDAPAFVLEQENERAARREAETRVQHAQAALADLGKGRRPEEIAVNQAQLAQAQDALKLAQDDLARDLPLARANFIAKARLDQDRSTVDQAQARVRELQSAVDVARLGGRSDALDAARQDVRTAEAQLAQANWRLEQKTLRVPLASEVVDVLYREGELVPAGTPVVSLLAPDNIRARFFVPESQLGLISLGRPVVLHCDSCRADLNASISFIASAAEYTAPLIYSKENRATLVFMIEARPDAAGARTLHPGQPLEVRFALQAAAR